VGAALAGDGLQSSPLLSPKRKRFHTVTNLLKKRFSFPFVVPITPARISRPPEQQRPAIDDQVSE
jgi:hypothetical protein